MFRLHQTHIYRLGLVLFCTQWQQTDKHHSLYITLATVVQSVKNNQHRFLVDQHTVEITLAHPCWSTHRRNYIGSVSIIKREIITVVSQYSFWDYIFNTVSFFTAKVSYRITQTINYFVPKDCKQDIFLKFPLREFPSVYLYKTLIKNRLKIVKNRVLLRLLIS
jgi:hypothetical protein